MSDLIAFLFRKEERYVTYYHFVVGNAPTEKKNPFSDRLLVAAYEDVCVDQQNGLWQRDEEFKKKLTEQCVKAKGLYFLAKMRSAEKK